MKKLCVFQRFFLLHLAFCLKAEDIWLTVYNQKHFYCLLLPEICTDISDSFKCLLPDSIWQLYKIFDAHISLEVVEGQTNIYPCTVHLCHVMYFFFLQCHRSSRAAPSSLRSTVWWMASTAFLGSPQTSRNYGNTHTNESCFFASNVNSHQDHVFSSKASSDLWGSRNPYPSVALM